MKKYENAREKVETRGNEISKNDQDNAPGQKISHFDFIFNQDKQFSKRILRPSVPFTRHAKLSLLLINSITLFILSLLFLFFFANSFDKLKGEEKWDFITSE